jgi:hypothetical protein
MGLREGIVGWTYAGALGFALVYLGEHYVVDLLAGVGLVLAVRRGERYVEPLAQAVSRALQRLERVAVDSTACEHPGREGGALAKRFSGP